MNDANNAGKLAPCEFCGTYPNPNDPPCATLEQAYARTEVRPFGCPYFTDSDRKMYPLSAPNAPVEPAGVVAELRASSIYSKGAMPLTGRCLLSDAADLLESQAKALSEAKAERNRIKAFLSEGDWQTIESEQAWRRRALAAEARLAEAMKVIEPFAKAGELFGPRDPDGYDQCIYGPAAGEEYSLKGDHLRAARAFTTRAQQESKDA